MSGVATCKDCNHAWLLNYKVEVVSAVCCPKCNGGNLSINWRIE
jgi:Zn finger protein HypA/HybF involved in hydrogenase expression